MSLKLEPVALAAVVKALLIVLVAFGVGLSTEQSAGILLLVEAVLAVVVRKSVTPMAGIEWIEDVPDHP